MLYFCVLFTRFARYGRSTLRPYLGTARFIVIWFVFLRMQHAASLLGIVRFIFICLFFLRTQHAASLLGTVRFIVIWFVFFADEARCVPTGGAFC